MGLGGKEDDAIAEADAREVVDLEVNSSSTQRVTPEEQRKWDDWAVASEMGMATPPKRRRVAIRVGTVHGRGSAGVLNLGDVPMGQPLRLTFTVALDSMNSDVGSVASSSTDSTDRVRLPEEQLVPFLESNLIRGYDL